jgi:hypothetical protein
MALSVQMSRGLGRIQLAVLNHIYEQRLPMTDEIAHALFGPNPTPAQWSSLYRALRRLRARALVASCGRHRLQWIMPRGVPKRLGWPGRGPGPDGKYGFDPARQRRNAPPCPCDSKGRLLKPGL